MLPADSPLLRNTHIFASQLDNETVMMDEEAGLYFGLNPVASTIWTLLETPMTLNQLTLSLTKQFNVSPQQCMLDIAPFLEKMLSYQLIQIAQPS